jgi:hypothetical protein
MESTCNRCHQPVDAESCYCAACGLPQLVYTSEGNPGQTQPDRLTEAVSDASSIRWRPALRAAMLVSIPAGLLSSGLSPVGTLGLFWMSAAAAWAVMIYVRGQRPAWITMGAGARIGFVTGLMAAWVAFAATGVSLFAIRDLMGQGRTLDQMWQTAFARVSQQWQALSSDPQTGAMAKNLLAWLQTPEGRAGSMLFGMAVVSVAMLGFAAIGGAVGARLLARTRGSGV